MLLLAYLVFDYDTSNKATAGRPDHIDGIASFNLHPHRIITQQQQRLRGNRHSQIPSGVPVYGRADFGRPVSLTPQLSDTGLRIAFQQLRTEL